MKSQIASGDLARGKAEGKHLALKVAPEPLRLQILGLAQDRRNEAQADARVRRSCCLDERAARCNCVGLGKGDISDSRHIASGLFAGLRKGDPPDLVDRFP